MTITYEEPAVQIREYTQPELATLNIVNAERILNQEPLINLAILESSETAELTQNVHEKVRNRVAYMESLIPQVLSSAESVDYDNDLRSFVFKGFHDNEKTVPMRVALPHNVVPQSLKDQLSQTTEVTGMILNASSIEALRTIDMNAIHQINSSGGHDVYAKSKPVTVEIDWDQDTTETTTHHRGLHAYARKTTTPDEFYTWTVARKDAKNRTKHTISVTTQDANHSHNYEKERVFPLTELNISMVSPHGNGEKVQEATCRRNDVTQDGPNLAMSRSTVITEAPSVYDGSKQNVISFYAAMNERGKKNVWDVSVSDTRPKENPLNHIRKPSEALALVGRGIGIYVDANRLVEQARIKKGKGDVLNIPKALEMVVEAIPPVPKPRSY